MTRGARRIALAGLASASLALPGTACFDPDYQEGLVCGPRDRCPADLVCSSSSLCVDPSSVDPDGAVIRPDGAPPDSGPPDAAQPDAAPDAAIFPDAVIPPESCDPVIQDCPDQTDRCTFLADPSAPEPPYEGYLGCAEDVGNVDQGDRCEYINTTTEGYLYDNCSSGLICDGQDGHCRLPCGNGVTCAIGESCEDIPGAPGLSYGLCQPSAVDAGGPQPL